MYDAIIIGAGPAGLQAALTLGRMHRSALLLDSGEYRNGAVAHMHNMIGADGMPPAELRAKARGELGAYAGIEIRDVRAESVAGSIDDFAVALADGTEARARRIVLATGIADDLPAVPGLADLWGRRAFSCPFCDGHEFRDARIAVLGASPRTAHVLGMLQPIVAEAVVLPIDEQPDADTLALIATKGGRVHPASVVSVEAQGDGVRVRTADGDVEAAGIFVAAGTMRQRAPFAAQLGLQLADSGAILIDEFGRTSLPGVSAAGDLAHRASLPGPLAAVVQASAAGMAAGAGIVQELSA